MLNEHFFLDSLRDFPHSTTYLLSLLKSAIYILLPPFTGFKTAVSLIEYLGLYDPPDLSKYLFIAEIL